MEKSKTEKLFIKNFTKDSPNQRLKSIKLPRDLSLGGTKLYKKVYKPNLNVVRNKIGIESKPKDEEKSKFKQHKIRDRVKPKFVQSSGVFSEAIISARTPLSPIVKVKQKPPSIPVTSVSTNTEKVLKINEKKEESLSKDIHPYIVSSDTDSDEESTFKAIQWDKAVFEKIIKEEKPYYSLQEHFSKCDKFPPTLNVWQMPDLLNFKKDEKLNGCSLVDMPEGIIGKICIRKSGKVDVSIGKVSYELESSSWECFDEHLMSVVNTDDKPQVSVLGALQKRYILSPNWNYLLCQ